MSDSEYRQPHNVTSGKPNGRNTFAKTEKAKGMFLNLKTSTQKTTTLPGQPAPKHQHQGSSGSTFPVFTQH